MALAASDCRFVTMTWARMAPPGRRCVTHDTVKGDDALDPHPVRAGRSRAAETSAGRTSIPISGYLTPRFLTSCPSQGICFTADVTLEFGHYFGCPLDSSSSQRTGTVLAHVPCREYDPSEPIER